MVSNVKLKSVHAHSSKISAETKSQAVAPAAFTKTFYDNVLATDLAVFSKADRAAIAAAIWDLAGKRKPGQVNVRLYNPSPAIDGWTVDHTVLEIINDDMPFLVDSVAGALQRRDLTVHMVIHPVLQVRRDPQGRLLEIGNAVAATGGRPESLMHIQFDHCLDRTLLKEIETDIRNVLDDVRAAVEDWPKMRERMQECIQAIVTAGSKDGREGADEAQAFLSWLDDNNFTYLGYRDIDLVLKGEQLASIRIQKNSGLGILRDDNVRMFGGLRDLDPKKVRTLQSYVRQNDLLIISKTNPSSRVHRQVPMDAIFLRRYDQDGRVIGERLFVGLFTSKSYSQNPQDVPFLRSKMDYAIRTAGFRPGSHDAKALIHILKNYPHDELFQITGDELHKNALGILQLQERARVALFVRRDPFERFVTCLIYVPRDRYDSALRHRIQAFFEQSFGGKAEDWFVRIDDSVLARAFITIQLNATSPHDPDLEKIESGLKGMCRSWKDRLRDALAVVHGEASALSLLGRYGDSFPASYRESVEPDQAVRDIALIEHGSSMTASGLTVDITHSEKTGLFHLRLFQVERSITLSEALPLIENMGLKVDYMGGPYEVALKNASHNVYIHEFVGRAASPLTMDFGPIKPAFETAFAKIWDGEVENDSFNMLTLRAGLGWREIVMLRACARYLRQLRIPYSQHAIATTLASHPAMTQQISMLFHARHNPDLKGNRGAKCKEVEAQMNEGLAKITALEEDRIVRRYINLVQASLRTNYFQAGKDGKPKSYLSIKFDSRAVEFMPLPKPLYEIFVYSARTEGVHLRGGKVARGGIRWSDRREDFRNEILGLMKAQMVKNTVIVPVGSKGGFIVKRPPAGADKLYAEGIECYRIFISGLLDITDNRVGSKIVPPANVVRYDEDDPYLVVAADKGTAKFSDIANGISQDYKFWLDDAFASGGSAGYDHKGMGITARGAWEAVKRHFRELGKNIQTTDFTCIGVGDMSGDVFGNGMLLSEHILLLGAFDHRHIFCDPAPDAARSFVERKRLFELPRSSWADYDSKKISKGGGIFSRSEKLIKLSPEMKKAYGVTDDSLSPAELIQAMLKAEVELLYFGGIGTYVKASSESHEDVGDRATEALRVDGGDLRAKVVGEGANLGMTQYGRIEYALKGGRLNTDAIDNSAGVDTSDHEVNIKILLRKIVDRGALTLEARNKLLGSMTDDVARLVLHDNYMQTQALSLSESLAAEFLPNHVRAIHLLEKEGLLNRAVEFLPDSRQIAERQRAGRGLTRPELAVLLAYAKIWLYQKLLDSNLPDDPSLRGELMGYFPETLQKKYADDIVKHQLGREIVATVLTNNIINRAGTPFVLTMSDRTGKGAVAVARAYTVARDVLGLAPLYGQIEALDSRVSASVQTSMHLILRRAMSKAVYWLLTEIDLPGSCAPIIDAYGKGLQHLAVWLKKRPAIIDPSAVACETKWVAAGVPEGLARQVASLPMLMPAFDVTRLAQQSGGSLENVAEVFFDLGKRLALDWLMQQGGPNLAQMPWQREAMASAFGELAAIHRSLAASIIGKDKNKKGSSPTDKLADWIEHNQVKLGGYDAQIQEWRGTGTIDLAMLILAAKRLREF